MPTPPRRNRRPPRRPRDGQGRHGAIRPHRTEEDRDEAERPQRPRERGTGTRPARERTQRPVRHATRTRAVIGTPEKSRSHSRSHSTAQLLSEDTLAKLDAVNERAYVTEKEMIRAAAKIEARAARKAEKRRDQQQAKKKRRVVSGPLLEKGEARYREEEKLDKQKRRRRIWIGIVAVIIILAILVPVGVVLGRKNSGNGDGASSSSAPKNSELESIKPENIPATAKGTILDPFVWYDTSDFNVTYTDATVGGLPVMGLFSQWDDSKQANSRVPPLDKPWEYGKLPIRGVNVGGWLSLEPFIAPSMFDSYDPKLGIVDEYTLTQHLGPADAAKTLEKHYATFITEKTFKDIAAAGLDHVRIPFSYWAVTTYPGDPYVPQISWRYLLRGIEWARKYGLRINLDLHAAPGSQNGWNHSGRQGLIGWLNGTEGALNGHRSLEIHDQLSQFFAQPRYQNIVAIYGLLNEPKMNKLDAEVVHSWSADAIQLVRKNGIKAYIAVADGFLGVQKWKGRLSQFDNLVLDVHQYMIFNKDQVGFPHKVKIDFACQAWAEQISQSTNTGFGPTLCGEWSQADTDCAPFLNNVNIGSRWTGTFNNPLDPNTQVLTPACPSDPNQPGRSQCDCGAANADPAQYSPAYKRFLSAYADAQMHSFEQGWGWFYWTWKTEKAVQWSWEKGRKAGILPESPEKRNEQICGGTVDLQGLEESY